MMTERGEYEKRLGTSVEKKGEDETKRQKIVATEGRDRVVSVVALSTGGDV
jgi:hypothetical protein